MSVPRFCVLYANYINAWIDAEMRDGAYESQDALFLKHFRTKRSKWLKPRTQPESCGWDSLIQIIGKWDLGDVQAEEIKAEWLAEKMMVGTYEEPLRVLLDAFRDSVTGLKYRETIHACREAWESGRGSK